MRMPFLLALVCVSAVEARRQLFDLSKLYRQEILTEGNARAARSDFISASKPCAEDGGGIDSSSDCKGIRLREVIDGETTLEMGFSMSMSFVFGPSSSSASQDHGRKGPFRPAPGGHYRSPMKHSSKQKPNDWEEDASSTTYPTSKFYPTHSSVEDSSPTSSGHVHAPGETSLHPVSARTPICSPAATISKHLDTVFPTTFPHALELRLGAPSVSRPGKPLLGTPTVTASPVMRPNVHSNSRQKDDAQLEMPSIPRPSFNVPSAVQPSPNDAFPATEPTILTTGGASPSVVGGAPSAVSPASLSPIANAGAPSLSNPTDMAALMPNRQQEPHIYGQNFTVGPTSIERDIPLVPSPPSQMQNVQPSIESGDDDGHKPSPPDSSSLPIASPSNQTGPRQCRSLNGVYGSLEGVRVGVSFGYELETIPIREEELLYEVLPALETAFDDYLLPFIDPDHCSASSRRLFLHNSVDGRPLLEVVGVSSRPDDLRIGSCDEMLEPGDLCNVFRGELSLYLVDVAANSAVTVETRENLIKGFENDYFKSADARIVRVSYVDLAQDDSSTPIESQEEPPGQSDESSDAVLIAILTIVAGVSLLVVGAVLVYRRRNVETVSHRRRQFEPMADDDANHMIDTGSEMGAADPFALASIKEEKHAPDDSDAEMGSDRQDEKQPFVAQVSSLYLEHQADGELVVKTTCPTASNFSESDDPMDRISPSDSSVYVDGSDNMSYSKEHAMSSNSLASEQDSQRSQFLF